MHARLGGGMADASDLKSDGPKGRMGSTPIPGTPSQTFSIKSCSNADWPACYRFLQVKMPGCACLFRFRE